jgi:hypothetical protein
MSLTAQQKEAVASAFVTYEANGNDNPFRQSVAKALGVDPYGREVADVVGLAHACFRDLKPSSAYEGAETLSAEVVQDEAGVFANAVEVVLTK